jgi:DNA-entry nuclease
MYEFENYVQDFIIETEYHVMYRVTPIYEGNNLVASGVLIEGLSVEDGGDGISFCVYAYNVQPGVEINYATGENWLANSQPQPNPDDTDKPDDTNPDIQDYLLNTNSKKFHKYDCSSAEKISDKNKEERSCTRDELIADGYEPCGYCKP